MDIDITEERISLQLEMLALDHPEWLEGVSNWSNHRPLLLLALSLTNGAVMEMGSGEGSTGLLKDFCQRWERSFKSFDNNEEWCKRTGAELAYSWNALIGGAVCAAKANEGWDLIFIDHAPGERRADDAIALKDAAKILVLHDTEEGGAGNYGWDKAWPHFKYRLNYNRLGGGAGATMVSNFIDVTVYRGLQIGPFKFDND